MRKHRPAAAQRTLRKRQERAKQDYEQALHACEEAASRIKCAGDELAACWSALCRELSSGVSATTLLRTRAMCNVLELRLKDQAHLLEDARHGVDAVWDQMMLATRTSELFNRMLNKGANLRVDADWPMLAHSSSNAATAAAPTEPARLKK